MSIDEYSILHQSVTAIEARQALMQMQILDYQNGKRNDRERFRKQISRLAYPKGIEDNVNTVSPEELIRMFGRG